MRKGRKEGRKEVGRKEGWMEGGNNAGREEKIGLLPVASIVY